MSQTFHVLSGVIISVKPSLQMSWDVSVCDFTLFYSVSGCSRRVSNTKPDALITIQRRSFHRAITTRCHLREGVAFLSCTEWKSLHQFFQHLFLQNKASGFDSRDPLRNSGLFPGGRISVVHKTSVGGVAGLWGQMSDWRKDQSFVSFVSDQFLRPSLLGFEAHHRTAICLCAEKVFLEVWLLFSDFFFFFFLPIIHQELQRLFFWPFNYLQPQLIFDIESLLQLLYSFGKSVWSVNVTK